MMDNESDQPNDIRLSTRLVVEFCFHFCFHFIFFPFPLIHNPSFTVCWIIVEKAVIFIQKINYDNQNRNPSEYSVKLLFFPIFFFLLFFQSFMKLWKNLLHIVCSDIILLYFFYEIRIFLKNKTVDHYHQLLIVFFSNRITSIFTRLWLWWWLQ